MWCTDEEAKEGFLQSGALLDLERTRCAAGPREEKEDLRKKVGVRGDFIELGDKVGGIFGTKGLSGSGTTFY
jgi:hypothetical protein